MRIPAALLTATAAVAGALSLAPAAGAATTCSVDPGKVLEIHMDTDGDATLLAVGPSGDIQVRGGGPVLTCADGSPTVANIDSILVLDDSDDPSTPAAHDGSTDVSIVDPDKLGTGKAMIVNLNAGFFDHLQVLGGAGPDHWAIGNDGIDLTADDDPAPDTTILTSTIPRVVLDAGNGDNVVSAQGGHGMGAPFSRDTELTLSTSSGNDTIDGSDSAKADLISAGEGDDTLRGFGGDDALRPGPGNDIVDGGAGSDTVGYSAPLAPPVTVDLTKAGPQDTGQGTDTITGIENIDGTSADDTLIGDAGPNQLLGEGGKDTFEGGPGDDYIGGGGLPGTTVSYAHAPSGETVDLTTGTASGGDGTDTLQNIYNVVGSPFADTIVGNAGPNTLTGLGGTDTIAGLGDADTIDVRDGGPDAVGCGSETDSVTADQRSVDAVNADCETVDFLPEPTPTTTTGTTDPGTTTTGGATTGTGTTGDTFLRFSLRGGHAQRVLRQKGLVVTASCPEEACTAIAAAPGAKPVAKPVVAGSTLRLKVRLSHRKLASLRRALRAGKRPALKVTVNAIDAAGNVVTRTLRVKVRR